MISGGGTVAGGKPRLDIQVFGPDGQVRLDLLRARTRYYLGVDLGKERSHSAMVVIERAELLYRHEMRDPVTLQFPTETRYFVRHAERFPLGVPFTDVATRVRELVRQPPLQGWVKVIVDGTGVGAAVLEMMRGNGGLQCRLIPVVITGGDRSSVTPGPDGRGYTVPKRDLLHGLVVAFENEWLEMAGSIGPALEVMVQELRSVRIRGNGGGGGYSGLSGAPTDDMVLALSLAWWGAKREQGWL
jgi:hypothetical protein